VNGDGLPDLVVGAQTGDGVYTVWGKSTNNAGRLHCTYRAGAGDDLGEVVAGTGDVTGDGIPDFLVGAWSNGFARVVGATAGSGTGGGPLTFPKQKVKAPLTRPATGALASGASGTLTIQTKGAKASLKLVLKNMPADGIYSVWLEDGVGAGTYTSVATIQVATGRGSVTISAEGQIPPELGVTDLADLVGRRAEVRDASGAVVLGLAIPSFLPLPTVKRKGTLTPVAAGSKASAAVKIAHSGGKSTDKFSVKAKKVDKGIPLRVWLETAVGSGTFADAGAMLVKGKYRRDTKKGDPLPLGVTSVTHLSGRKIQVRNGSEVLLSGVIP
jgi:hypothetical protein